MPSSFGLVAQLVEQRIENPRVGGSIPPQATKHLFKMSRKFLAVSSRSRNLVSSPIKYGLEKALRRKLALSADLYGNDPGNLTGIAQCPFLPASQFIAK
jgi:hypothetical protein